MGQELAPGAGEEVSYEEVPVAAHRAAGQVHHLGSHRVCIRCRRGVHLLWFGPSRVIAFALLTLLCVPIGMLYSKLKGSLKNAILTKEDDADGDAA